MQDPNRTAKTLIVRETAERLQWKERVCKNGSSREVTGTRELSRGEVGILY